MATVIILYWWYLYSYSYIGSLWQFNCTWAHYIIYVCKYWQFTMIERTRLNGRISSLAEVLQQCSRSTVYSKRLASFGNHLYPINPLKPLGAPQQYSTTVGVKGALVWSPITVRTSWCAFFPVWWYLYNGLRFFFVVTVYFLTFIIEIIDAKVIKVNFVCLNITSFGSFLQE